MLAWVGIVAGILFIVAVVFFSGFFAARATCGYGCHRGYQNGQMGPGSSMSGGCPMMQMMPLVGQR
jgi:polyferredoxin